MSDIVESLNRLRTENPEMASALRRARGDGVPSYDPNYAHSAAHLGANSQAAGSDSKEFLEARDADRDAMGVGNWVFKHRDEVAAGDAERLSKRLEAAENFARAEAAIEGFRRDSAAALPCPGTAILSAGDPGGIVIQPDVGRVRNTNPYDLPTASSYLGISGGAGLLSGRPGGSSVGGGGGGATPGGASGGGGGYSSYGSGGGSPSSYSRAKNYGAPPTAASSARMNPRHHSDAASSLMHAMSGTGIATVGGDAAGLDTHSRYGDIDEMANYETKRKQMTRSSIADRVRQSLEPQHFASVDVYTGLNAPLAAAVRTSAIPPQNDAQSISALMDTIGIRDATIARLEAQIREERRFHESALTEVKEENEHLKEQLRRYDAETSKTVEEIRNSTASEVRSVKEQHARELDAARLRFDQRVKSVEDDMMKSLSAARQNFEAALARVDDLQDTSAAQFRQTLREERSEALSREKTSLVELLSREQEVLLRDGEQRIMGDLSRQLHERARTELQRIVAQQTTEVLLPSLKELVTRDVVKAISERATAAAEAHVEERSRAVRIELERTLQEGEKRLEDAASRLAAGSVVRWSGAVPLIDGHANTDGVAAFKHHAELMRKLQDDADRLLREQRDNETMHAQKIAALKAQLQQTESELNSEKGVSAALAERLLHVSN